MSRVRVKWLQMATPFGVLVLGVALAAQAVAEPMFRPDERDRVLEYWRAPGRLTIADPEKAATDGPWVGRLTPEGSQWLWRYQSVRGPKASSGLAAAETNLRTNPNWDEWIQAKYAYDAWVADESARLLNEDSVGAVQPTAGPPPPLPGPIPRGLRDLVGEPPPLCMPVRPQRYVVNFHDMELSYEDHVPVRPKYAYFRWTEGVMSGGRPLRSWDARELAQLFEQAGLGEVERRVFLAVSGLEGGFDSVNTYDTGWVSVGFIQFAALQSGSGSLGAVLAEWKDQSPTTFEQEFRRFGLDVTPNGALVALDLDTGEELVGQGAARQIIRDKRLVAVFQRAGRVCPEFRVAQLRVAHRMYYPGMLPLILRFPNYSARGTVGDVIRSEAGLAILMDRKVHTGSLDALEVQIQQLIRKWGLVEVSEVADLEWEIVTALVHRRDFLADNSLSRPRQVAASPSRSGSKRSGRPVRLPRSGRD